MATERQSDRHNNRGKKRTGAAIIYAAAASTRGVVFLPNISPGDTPLTVSYTLIEKHEATYFYHTLLQPVSIEFLTYGLKHTKYSTTKSAKVRWRTLPGT